MRLTRSFAWALLLALFVSPAWSQAPRLQFLNRVKDGTTLSGAVTVKVSADPILRPKGIKVGVQVDGELKETSDSLPWVYVWDSTNEPDGKHVITLVLVNTRTKETGPVDEMQIQTLNRPVRLPTPTESPKSSPPSSPGEASKRTEPKSDEPSRPAPKLPAQDPQSERASARTSQRASETSLSSDPVVSRATDALEYVASSLQVEAGKLLIGRRDASLTVFDPASRDGWTVKAPLAAGTVLSAARSGNRAAWLCAEEAAETSGRGGPSVARWLFVYDENEKKVRAFDLRSASLLSSRVSLWQGNAVLTGTQGGCLLEMSTGEFKELGTLLELEEAHSLRGAETAFVSSGGTAMLAAIGKPSRSTARRGPAVLPGELMAWKTEGGKWAAVTLPSLAEAGIENVRQLALASERIGLLTTTGLVGVAVSDKPGDIHRSDYPQSDQTWRTASQISVSGAHLWSVKGTSLFHADAETGQQDAFLPWNAAGLVPQVIAADADVLWVGTNQGIKRLCLTKPDERTGYAGFVRARLGTEQDRPVSSAAQRLTQEIDSWQGTPYVWGGETRNGVDCSGFVMRAFQGIGVNLSHGSDWLRTCDMGRVIKDELAYGDVLIIPGHCMIYTGDGTTAETVSKSVGRASIWRRGTGVVIRRFLGTSDIETKSFASRSGGYGKQRPRAAQPRKGR